MTKGEMQTVYWSTPLIVLCIKQPDISISYFYHGIYLEVDVAKGLNLRGKAFKKFTFSKLQKWVF